MSEFKYLGNPKLKKVGSQHSFTQEQKDEYIKCASDPIYFINRYVKVITLDSGFQEINLYPFQKECIKSIHDFRYNIIKAGRQVGKTTTVVGYLVWYITFNSDKLVAILANKAKTAREILARVKIAYEELPHWIQQGVRTWNKGDIELENNSRVLAESTASTAIRGFAISFLYLDEFAFVPNNIAEEFFASVYPTITSGKSSKILISSTPNGMNHFYKMWVEATEGKNGFKNIEASWREVPGRTEEWALQQKSILGDDRYLQEMECEFQGSIGTLISGYVLKSLTFRNPTIIQGIKGLHIHYEPKPGNRYISVVDTSRGKGLDYSAFVIVDVTNVPYKTVCVYKDNDISPIVFPSIISKMGSYYNDAFILVEINDNGQQVADGLFHEYEYENLLSTATVKKNTFLTWSYNGSTGERGVRTTKSVKRLGCSLLKSMIESHKLLVEDFEIISELSTFINKKNSYEADEGANDDLVMCLVLFAWASNQSFFADLCHSNIKEKLFREQMQSIEENMLPLPLNGEEAGLNPNQIVEDGSVWDVVNF